MSAIKNFYLWLCLYFFIFLFFFNLLLFVFICLVFCFCLFVFVCCLSLFCVLCPVLPLSPDCPCLITPLGFSNVDHLLHDNTTTCTTYYTPAPRRGRGYTVLPLSVLPSVQDIFRRILISNCWWQKSDIWSQVSYRYTILWEAFLDPSDSYFLFADFVDFDTHLTYICICTFFVAFF